MDAKCYTEVYTVLEQLELIEKIPDRVVKNIRNKKDNDFIFNIDKDIPLKFQINNKDTLSMLSYIYLKYVCDSDDKRKKLAYEVKRTENIKSQDEKIFNVDVINENKEIIELPEIKSESWIKHLINRIFKIFK